uniref:NADH-ubiquinone oxidoreductase chain 4 n=1 Tax=Stichopus horrens TaxID=566292 RepID=E1AR81_9ECHN|nr:NADH dehydrogenase subunit 4 [Stichopus horrens]ADL59821.1 NADH dehydrogenase subunit 4 [Stichopus horrens]
MNDNLINLIPFLVNYIFSEALNMSSTILLFIFNDFFFSIHHQKSQNHQMIISQLPLCYSWSLSPTIVLSCWLAPLCFLAQNILKNKSKSDQNSFLLLTSTIVIFLILTFSSLNILSFFVCFRSHPHTNPNYYYTMSSNSSTPPSSYLLSFLYTIRLLTPTYLHYFYKKTNILLITDNNNTHNPPIILILHENMMINNNYSILSNDANIWFSPMTPQGTRGSPNSRINDISSDTPNASGLRHYSPENTIPSSNTSSSILIIFCCWGSLITSILCTRQTDLKALIAYSSVGHMSLVSAGSLLFSEWSINGALILMIAHGLVSSALFALANVLYERTHTRNIFITRGFKTITVLLPLWWLIACAANLGLPPFPNLIGEIFIITNAISWSIFLTPLVGIATIFGAIYSLLIFQNTNTQKNANHTLSFLNVNPREHLLFFLHLFPLIGIIINPNSCMLWFK